MWGLRQHDSIVGAFLLLVVPPRVSALVLAAVAVGLGAHTPAHGFWASSGGGYGGWRGGSWGGRGWVFSCPY